jgi:3'-phosphoadenosine 5'-phosphosulfate sulfotransferase (PAPS reductase)/FAD synthetase
MYPHIRKVQTLCPVEIDIVKIDFDYYFGEHVKTKGKYVGQRGYGWPDFRIRWCTFKKKEAKLKYYKEHGLSKADIVEYVGIAADETDRGVMSSNYDDGYKKRFPLVEWGVTEQQALEYCYSRGLDWGGLYEKFHRVSCWCCPLSRISELRVLYNDFPALWDELVEMDKKSYRQFRCDYSVDDLTKRFAKENL